MKFTVYMKKYMCIIHLTLKQSLIHKGNILPTMVSGLIPLLTSYYLWNTAYSNNIMLAESVNISKILTYILSAYLLNLIISPFGIEWEIASYITEGKIAKFIMYPISFIMFCFAKLLGEKLFILILRLPIIILIISFNNFFISPSTQYFFLFIISASLSFFLYTYFSLCIGFSAFWLNDVTGLFYLTNSIIILFSGLLMPVDFFPYHIMRLLEYLPLYYIIYFPIKIFLQDLTIVEIINGYFLQLFWLSLMHITTKTIFQKGIKIYENYGN